LKGFFLIWELYSTIINCSAPWRDRRDIQGGQQEGCCLQW
jgi:hypothetical protein